MDYRKRTERKLRYAKIHLDELIFSKLVIPGSDFERAHIESFLFHLIGARDTFLQEINLAYSLGLKEGRVKTISIREEIQKKNIRIPAFEQLTELEKEQNPPSWLNEALYFRNRGTHRMEISQFVELGGCNHNKAELIGRPKKGHEKWRPSGKDFIEDFKVWHNNMIILLKQLRDQLPKPGEPSAAPDA